MRDEDTGVAVARWSYEAQVASIASVRNGVDGFAGRHGMSTAARADLAAAVSEAVADAVEHGRGLARPGNVLVDAATDGAWITVRVAGDAPRDPPPGRPALPLVMALSDRFECWQAREGAGRTVLMEFAMTPRRDGGGAGRRAPARHAGARIGRLPRRRA